MVAVNNEHAMRINNDDIRLDYLSKFLDFKHFSKIFKILRQLILASNVCSAIFRPARPIDSLISGELTSLCRTSDKDF